MLAGLLLLTQLGARDPSALARWGVRWRVYRAGGRVLSADDVVRQVGLNDCGPAALANALRLGGYADPSLATLTRLAGTAAQGTSLLQLRAAAQALGVRSFALAGRDARLAGPGAGIRWPLPLITWVDSSHFVVVERVTRQDVWIVDPAVGRYTLPHAAVRGWWSNAVLVVPPHRRSP